MANKITIEETPNVIDDHLLDIIGNEFKFDHAKGMAEWLKNSVDAYRTNEVKQEDQHVFFRFTDQGVTKPIMECIDFVGMTKTDIEKALKRWGDPNAAKRGKKIKVYGGHGNGGKFYMRQMFKESHFLTYKNGLLNIFGFNDVRKYGFAQGYQDKKMKPAEALKFAELNGMPIPENTKNKILKEETGFTVVRGLGPDGIRGKFKIAKEIEKLRNHPQSRRILTRSNVSVYYNGILFCHPVKPEDLEPMSEFKEPRVVTVPKELKTGSGSEKITVKMADAKYPPGKLTLKTSLEPLARGSRLGELNRIDILGEIGVIGSYQLSEMGVTGFPHAASIYGEFGPATDGDASILEDPENDCVSNDRAKLVSNDTTRALIEWIAQEVDKLAAEIAGVEREKHKASQKEITSKFNDVLNEWKNKHMKKIMSELFGKGSGDGGGESEGSRGTEVTTPPNGFDFKFPQAEIEVKVPSKLTLKVTVPQSLPMGATIFVNSDSEDLSLKEDKVFVKSDYLKTTPGGQDVAFINIEVTGLKVGSEGFVSASAGKLRSEVKIIVIEKKDKDSGHAFPRVLLSGHDEDPLGMASSGTLSLGERDPVVYQRPQDVKENIFWVNTSSPMASKIYDKFTFNSIQWRNYLFERYVDIFVKEAIHELENKDLENFNADAVDQKIAEVVRKVHQNANEDLDRFLFDEEYTIQDVKS